MSDDAPEFNMSVSEQARMADELLKNPLLKQIFGELDSGAVDVWRRSTSAQQREDQWHMVTCIAAVVKQLNARLDTIKLQDQQRRARATGRMSV